MAAKHSCVSKRRTLELYWICFYLGKGTKLQTAKYRVWISAGVRRLLSVLKKLPHRLWSPTSVLFKGFWDLFPGGKDVGAWSGPHSLPLLVPSLRKCNCSSASHIYIYISSWRVWGKLYLTSAATTITTTTTTTTIPLLLLLLPPLLLLLLLLLLTFTFSVVRPDRWWWWW